MRLAIQLVVGAAAVVGCIVAPDRAWGTHEFRGAEITLTEYLVLPRVGRYGRVPIHVDPLQAQLAAGTWDAPAPGEELQSAESESVRWESATADSKGWIKGNALRGGYAYARVISTDRQVVLLEASGHAMVFVNGEPRVGDPYVTSRTVLPILLEPGVNEFLFHGAAGRLRVRLTKPGNDVVLDSRDSTVPTLIRGESEPVWLGMLLVNARDRALTDAQVTAIVAGGEKLTAKAPSVPPLGVRKVAVALLPPKWASVADDTNELTTTVVLAVDNESVTQQITLQVVEPSAPQTRTFRSAIDGSVQEYRLLPAATDESQTVPAMLVTLHGANETAAEHLQHFSARPGVHLLAPSGRRVEGCDWEDWSARDALEALDDVTRHVKFDNRRVWLRGTGTGGHGVLRLGGIAADRWAALVPREPWLEYPTTSETTAATPLEEMLDRAAWSKRLTPLLRNTVICGLLLEYDASGTRTQDLREVLESFHPKFQAKPIGDAADTLDQVLEFCQKHTASDPATVEEVDCVTYFPGENATIHWLTIWSQQQTASLSRAAVRFEAKRNLFVGLTVNVAVLGIDVSHLELDTIVEVVLDGEAVGEFAVDGTKLIFLRNEAGWVRVPTVPPSFKQPQRYGGMQSAFESKPLLVYGTRGTLAERQWALAKARYDAETILVRRNGAVDVVPDTAFNPNGEQDRSVVLYGNANTNSAWPQLMSLSPVQVRREGVWIERRPEQGVGLSCVFVRPRRGSDTAVVGAVSGNDVIGMRATDRLPFFVNGTVFPDLLLFSANSLTQGNNEVRAAGYFGRVWTVDPGEIVWRDPAL